MRKDNFKRNAVEGNGIYYMRARYYDANVGRFISEDPAGFDGGDVNLYAYVRNNPIMNMDPNGQWLVGGIIGGFAGAIGGVNAALINGGSFKAALAGGFFGGISGAVVGGVLPDFVGISASSTAGAMVGSVAGGAVGGAVGGVASDLTDKGYWTASSVKVGAATGAFSGLVAAPGIGLAAIATGGSELGMGLAGAAGSILGDTIGAAGPAIYKGFSCGK